MSRDSEDYIIGTSQKPLARVNMFVFLSVKGYIKTIRPDITSKRRVIPLHDESTHTAIQLFLQTSKNFKQSIGIHYKKKIITLSNRGIQLK